VVALACNLDLFGSRFLAGLTAVLVASLRRAPAWQVRALALLIGRHHLFSSFVMGSAISSIGSRFIKPPHQGLMNRQYGVLNSEKLIRIDRRASSPVPPFSAALNSGNL
jgi:hypothetical protein